MPPNIVIRLVPVEPTTGSDFTAYLTDLTITAFDVSFDPPPDPVVLPQGAIEPIPGIFDPPPGVFLGQARYLPPTPADDPNDPPIPDPDTRIVQHFGQASVMPSLPPAPNVRLSVATAVIDVSSATHPEHASRDVRLIVTRGGGEIIYHQVYYNVPLDTGAVPPAQFPQIATTSIYLSLPVAGSELNAATDAYVDLPQNGAALNFDDLRAAVELVLTNDPGAGFDLAALTHQQAAQIAKEIAWNRKFHPLPVPKPLAMSNPSPPLRMLELMYTLAGTDEDTETDEPARKQFEAALLTYYSLRDADAQRLATSVFALSAALWASEQTQQVSHGERAGFTCPVQPGVTATGERYKQATVILTGDGGPLNPVFRVPAIYFYALGAQLSIQISREQRLHLARLDDAERLRTTFRTAIDDGVIVADPNVNPAQAARRLRALGSDSGAAPEFALGTNTQVQALVQAWLAFTGDAIDDFWNGALPTHEAAHLDLVLWVLTRGYLVNAGTSLAAEIESQFAVTSTEQLAQQNAQDWQAFFDNHPTFTANQLLPPFTEPGSAAEQVAAFIRHVKKFFALTSGILNPDAPSLDGLPRFPPLINDPLNQFALNYGNPPLAFGQGLDAARVAQAVQATFPSDDKAQRWLEQAVRTIEALAQLTAGVPEEVRFSVMEALYARGFTGVAQVQALTLDAFQDALTGSVAFPFADLIYGEGQDPGFQPDDGWFQPVNPDGCLTNCIPPPHFSPLGPVAYLSELLQLKASSTCDDPFPESESSTLATILVERRGPLADLAASRSNLEVPLPLIDLVTESLEHIAANLTPPATGIVYNTNRDTLGRHTLSTNPSPADPDAFQHDASILFAALPEHATPASPVAVTGGYAALRSAASHPLLPYDQPLDINRSYLRHLRTTRCETMRHFRRDITELAIDPANEPGAFQRHLWRYPLRIEIALECLGISAAEYATFFSVDIVLTREEEEEESRGPFLWEVYGFSSQFSGASHWTESVIWLPEFLKRTGLDYCAFLDLWRSEFVRFGHRGEGESGFPACEPCDLDRYRIIFREPDDPRDALRRLIVFIRLWHKLQDLPTARYSFAELADICQVLGLFDDSGVINPDFIRQLAAFQQLRDHFRLALTDGSAPAPGAVGADRTHLLALWIGPNAAQWDWALDELLDQVQWHEIAIHGCPPLSPKFIKLLAANLDDLSRLAGFNPDQASDAWHARPAHTLRFAEILAKMYASPFGVGEILFLFGADAHLHGDDPFPLQSDNEALESPFAFPDDDMPFTLWDLRHRLLTVEVTDDEAADWNWMRIESVLRGEFDYRSPSTGPDPLLTFGQHFFPTALEDAGFTVSLTQRQYRVALAPPAAPARYPELWNTPPEGPFRYDVATQELYTQLPLTDEAVIAKLARLRPLTAAEQNAVRTLYFAPRAAMAPFALIFSNVAEAEERLIQEPDEAVRWTSFQREFARCYRRCQIIAEHLAAHVGAWREQASDARSEHASEQESALAWRLLQSLFADENRAVSSWESDSGQPPAVTWPDQPAGSAFAALLGLCGTGLRGELHFDNGDLAWRELRGPLTAFGVEENLGNAPIPTVVPPMGLTLTSEQERFVFVRNGFAGSNPPDTELLGGADGYSVRWSGALLVDNDGDYTFWAGAPTAEGEEPDFAAAADKRWRVRLQRGVRSWVVHSYHWPDEHAPPHQTDPLNLQRGVYQLTVEYVRPRPPFARREDVHPQTGGFQLKYAGPDSSDAIVTVPFDRLFQEHKDAPLSDGIEGLSGTAQEFLRQRYTSSIRDIRRTYQRAFKALLFAQRLDLSAQPVADTGQSEIGYMREQAERFLGISYNRTGGGAIQVHRAWFDPNFFPVRDNYFPPPTSQDRRASPSLRRRRALFDWLERLYDYSVARSQTQRATEQPLWLLFHEAAERHVDNPAQLLRHMGVDMRHVGPEPLVLRYFENVLVTAADLEDDRWAVRVWRAELYVRRIEKHFFVHDIRVARPDRWAADDPGVIVGSETESGNTNLTRFVRDGCIENGDPRRYEDIKRLNDGLRERGRSALLAYLCTMNRVIFFGQPIIEPRGLSELLLIDVEADLCQQASRIEEAISAVQRFVLRARLGIEPGFAIGADFLLLWERRFATFHSWELCKRRELYRENWIDWNELETARRGESFQFLEAELRRAALTVPVPSGLEYWPDQRPPSHPGLQVLQAREPAHIRRILPQDHGFDLLGTPERHARPSWLAALGLPTRDGNGEDGGGAEPMPRVLRTSPDVGLLRQSAASDTNIPFWIRAAIRLGVRFIRVAAAAEPPASTTYAPQRSGNELSCCAECDRPHPALVDEYYFWLLDHRFYTAPEQDAEWSWHDPNFLPPLLHWEDRPTVHLAWCRVHNGEFKQLRRSAEGVPITPDTVPELSFHGRAGDSLRFAVSGGLPPAPEGYAEAPAPGFRYDLATDTAIALPLVVIAPEPDESVGVLPAYPYFVYFAPGAPVMPQSLYAPAVAVAAWLRSHCRYEAALKWYALAHDTLHADNRWARCDDDEREPVPDDEREPIPDDDEREPIPDDNEVRSLRVPSGDDVGGAHRIQGDCCHKYLAVDDAQARERAILLSALETLLAWGDALLHRNSPEAFQQARLLYDTIDRVLGPPPRTVVAADPVDPAPTIAAFTADEPALNPRLLALYGTNADRLALIQACLNAHRLRNGTPNKDMPFWGNSALRNGWQSTAQPCLDDADWCAPESPYRFMFLIQRALDLSNEVRNLGAALLSAYEKGDAEFLASLRTTQEHQLLELAREVRQQQWREADWQMQALQKTKELAQTNRRYYAQLLQNGLIGGEEEYVALTGVALGSRAAANIAEGIGQGIGVSPDFFFGIAGFGGTPLFYQQIPSGSKLAGVFATIARIANGLAEIATTTAGLRLTQAGWDRREDEWRHQVEVFDIEIEQIERQILAAARRRDAALIELNNHQRQIEHAAEVQNFLRDKFTSHELYLFLQQETAARHQQMYELALRAARQAERAFNFEQGHTAQRFVQTESWNSLREGLLVGDRLQLDLRRMEQSYLDAHTREYELTKHISLRLHFPMAFLQLQATGSCEIELPEWMFDRDYPGHYMRRITNVSLTLPCVVGPYTGIHCRLTLLSSRTRISPHLADPPAPCCPDGGPDNGYFALPDDPRIVAYYAATEAIATSSGQNDTGMFELNFRDERYLPFEFQGAVSRWRLELPSENNDFDLTTLADVVMHLNYRTREGGDTLRGAANELAQRMLPGAGLRYFDVQHDMPDAWHVFQRQPDADLPRALHLRLNRAMFPFMAGRRTITLRHVELFFEASWAEPSAHYTLTFQPALRDQCNPKAVHHHTTSFECVASADWPGLFHGRLDLENGSSGHHDELGVGVLHVPAEVGPVVRVLLLCAYEA